MNIADEHDGVGNYARGSFLSASQSWKHRAWNETVPLPPRPPARATSVTNCSFVIDVSQASHVSPPPRPLEILPIRLCGRRPSWTLCRTNRRRAWPCSAAEPVMKKRRDSSFIVTSRVSEGAPPDSPESRRQKRQPLRPRCRLTRHSTDVQRTFSAAADRSEERRVGKEW